MNHKHRRVVRPKINNNCNNIMEKKTPLSDGVQKPLQRHRVQQSKACGHTRPRAWVEAPELATGKAASTGRTSNAGPVA